MLTKSERLALIGRIMRRYLEEPESTYAAEDVENALSMAGLEPMPEFMPKMPTIEDLSTAGYVYLEERDKEEDVTNSWDGLKSKMDGFTLAMPTLAPIIFALAAYARAQEEKNIGGNVVGNPADWGKIADHLEIAAETAASPPEG